MTAAVQTLPPVIGQSYYAPTAVKSSVVDDVEKNRRLFNTSYEPNLSWWNSDQVAYTKGSQDPLPDGFPAEVKSASVWDGKKLIHQPERWIYQFTSEDIDLINAAFTHFRGLNLPNNDISQETFPIPQESTLYKALKQTLFELNHGLGFRVLRGLPVDSWERQKQILVFAGLSAYISPQRITNQGNHITHLRDITNIAADKRPAIVVKGQTSGNQVFHNDGSAGIISLLTLGVAETGGLSQLSSVGQTYNQLASTRRDIIRELAQPTWKNKQHPEGRSLIFAVGDEQVVSIYSRRPYFGFYDADADVPPLSKEKHLALDAVHFTAEKFSLDVDLQKGDLEYLNNVTVYHARTSSEDSEKNQRHLIRLWLRNEEQPLPIEWADTAKILGGGHGWPQEAWDV